METKTIAELKQTLLNPNAGYKYVYFDKLGQNNFARDFNTHVEKIVNKLQIYDEQNAVGIYTITASPHKKKAGETCDTFNVKIGNLKTETMSNNINIPQDFTSALNHPAIKLQAEIATLKIQNEALENEVAILIEENMLLNQELEELQEQLKNMPQLGEQPSETPFETAKGMFGQIIEYGAPLLDKWFDLQQEKNNILRAQTQQQQQQIKNFVPQKLPIELKIETWINSKAEEPQIFDDLQAIYFNSDSVQKFAELLKNYNENLYNECKAKVN